MSQPKMMSAPPEMLLSQRAIAGRRLTYRQSRASRSIASKVRPSITHRSNDSLSSGIRILSRPPAATPAVSPPSYIPRVSPPSKDGLLLPLYILFHFRSSITPSIPSDLGQDDGGTDERAGPAGYSGYNHHNPTRLTTWWP